jgi:HK97 gp10 family phage protein
MTLKWHGDEIKSDVEKAVTRGLTAAAILVQGQAIELAPVDLGNLKGSITYTVAGQRSQVRHPATVNEGIGVTDEKKTAYIGTNVEYAPYQELGTSKMKAQPFLRPALDNQERQINEVFAKNVKAGLEGG